MKKRVAEVVGGSLKKPILPSFFVRYSLSSTSFNPDYSDNSDNKLNFHKNFW